MDIKVKTGLVRILKELPIFVFLLYLAYLCVLFHQRDHRMLDYTLTFDHWWYFHYRLSECSLVQWNPYALLGKLAVQWNYIPLSVLFSPFLVFTELDLDTFHVLFIIGTWLSISVLYFAGRLLHYDRFLSLVPVLVMITGGYRYLCALLNHSTFLFFYPLAIVCLLSALGAEGRKAISRWLLCVTLMAFSFIAARFEFTVYAYTFVFLIFAVLGIYQVGNWNKMRKFFLIGIIVTVMTCALTAWQLPFLLSSTFESSRVSSGIHFQKLFNLLLFKWTLLSLLYQPALILLVLNGCLWGVVHYWKSGLSGKISARLLNMKYFLIITGGQFLLMRLILWIPPTIGLSPVRAFVPANTHPAYQNLDIVFSRSGVIAILLLVYFYSVFERRITSVKALKFWATMFAGFYVAEYSWHIWPINENTHFFFMIPLFASFLSCGAVRLMMRGKTWILAVLVLFHFIGETEYFYLYEVFGIPWLAPRAALAEIPFQIILILETLLFLIEGGDRLLGRAFPTRQCVLFGKIYSLSSVFSITVKTVCVIGVFLTIKMFLMPVGVSQVSVADPVPTKIYLREYPFAEAPVNNLPVRINQVAYEAKKNAEHLRDTKKHLNPLKRAYVDASVVSTSDNMFYKFLPAYSQTLNTAPLYATELSKIVRTIFIPDFEGKEGTLLRKPHPEMNPTFIDYKRAEGRRVGIDDIFGNQSTPVMIYPHERNEVLYREIIAEEGAKTPRAFLTCNVVCLNRYVDEYEYLNSTLARGNLLTDHITTSDSRFPKTNQKSNDMPLAYTLEFKKDDPEHIVLDVKSSDNSYLALMDAWSKGWRAYVDGKETVIYRGYIGNRFIRIQAGNHIVEFKYTVPGLMGASIISALAWIATFSLLVIYWRKNSKKLKC